MHVFGLYKDHFVLFVVFKKSYSRRLGATQTMDILKSTIGSDFMKGTRAQSYYQNSLVSKRLLKHEGVIALVESPSSDDTIWNSLGISQLDDVGLYTSITKELANVIGAASEFKKNQINQASFNVRISYTSKKMFLEKLKVGYADHCTHSTREVA